MSATSTVTSKWQITIPEDVRKEIDLQIGQRIAWEIRDGKLIGRRVRSVAELAGCLKQASRTSSREKVPQSFAQAAQARHDRLSKARK